MSETKTKLRVFLYPVNPLHSSVRGYSAMSKYGKQCWDKLDWSEVFPDGFSFGLSLSGFRETYLRVQVKYDPDQDGTPDDGQRRQCHVRCWHEVGTKWRGGVVSDVKVEKQRRSQNRVQWMWIVTVDGEKR